MQPRIPRSQSLPRHGTMAGSGQPFPFTWEHRPNCGQINSGEEVGPGHVGNEQGSGTRRSPVTAIASEFELMVIYIRAGGRQRRDCMCLFLPSTTPALLLCPALRTAFAPAVPSLHLLAPHSPHRQICCKPSSLHPCTSHPVASELMTSAEPAYQENCLCDETCQPREYIKGRGRLSVWDGEHWAMESPAKGLFTRTIIPNNISRPNLATRIQALHSNRQEIVSSQCNPCSCPSPAKQA